MVSISGDQRKLMRVSPETVQLGLSEIFVNLFSSVDVKNNKRTNKCNQKVWLVVIIEHVHLPLFSS